MSSYLDPAHPSRHAPYDDVPPDVTAYLRYLETIINRSPRTVNGYYIDLRTFFRFLVQYRGLADRDLPLEQIPVAGLDRDFIRAVTKEEIYEYLYYLSNQRQNQPAARARKLSSIKGFFHYMTAKTGFLPQDPSEDISVPALRKSLPKYLSLEESIDLLKNIQSDFYERDFCIITLFLNCGMRLTELVGINLTDFKDETIRIVGKGDKERLVYLNAACIGALRQYIAERAKMPNLRDKNALFVSRRTGKRLSNRRVEQIVSDCLRAAGLDGKGYSPHKLRHTAATLMYRHGNVDMLALKEILGHEHVTTTEIYTHINTEKLQDAVSSSPLARMKFAPPEKPKAAPPEDEPDAPDDAPETGERAADTQEK